MHFLSAEKGKEGGIILLSRIVKREEFRYFQATKELESIEALQRLVKKNAVADFQPSSTTAHRGLCVENWSARWTGHEEDRKQKLSRFDDASKLLLIL